MSIFPLSGVRYDSGRLFGTASRRPTVKVIAVPFPERRVEADAAVGKSSARLADKVMLSRAAPGHVNRLGKRGQGKC